jgi:hypothetical protein
VKTDVVNAYRVWLDGFVIVKWVGVPRAEVSIVQGRRRIGRQSRS